jgi:hypothetical protein
MASFCSLSRLNRSERLSMSAFDHKQTSRRHLGQARFCLKTDMRESPEMFVECHVRKSQSQRRSAVGNRGSPWFASECPLQL